MTASSWRTWQDRTPGFKITDMGPQALARTLNLAILSKAQKGETEAGAFGYESGSPQAHASDYFDTRFAGERLIGGINGEFGSYTNDKKNKNAQDSLATWAGQWSSGPFGLGVAGGPAPEEEAPPASKQKVA